MPRHGGGFNSDHPKTFQSAVRILVTVDTQAITFDVLKTIKPNDFGYKSLSQQQRIRFDQVDMIVVRPKSVTLGSNRAWHVPADKGEWIMAVDKNDRIWLKISNYLYYVSESEQLVSGKKSDFHPVGTSYLFPNRIVGKSSCYLQTFPAAVKHVILIERYIL